MPIEDLNLQIKIKVENSEVAEIISSSLNPDNLAIPPMAFSCVNVDNIIIFKIENFKKIETASATLQDLLSAFQAAASVIKISSIVD